MLPPGKHDERQLRVPLRQGAGQFHPVHAGHVVIRKHQIGPPPFIHRLQGLPAPAEGTDRVPQTFEHPRNERQLLLVVLDEEKPLTAPFRLPGIFPRDSRSIADGGQKNVEPRAFRRCMQTDRPAVSAHNAVHHGQPQSRSSVLGREEGVVDLVLDGLVNAGAFSLLYSNAIIETALNNLNDRQNT